MVRFVLPVSHLGASPGRRGEDAVARNTVMSAAAVMETLRCPAGQAHRRILC